MISVAEALDHLFDLVSPLGTETIDLRDAAGRVLAKPVTAGRDQPPFSSSAMDGYALPDPAPSPGKSFKVVGEAAAGAAWSGKIDPGQAVRIFTGAPVPNGGKSIVIQEDVLRDGNTITINPEASDFRDYIRPAGSDFKKGQSLPAPCRLRPVDLALAAAMNAPRLEVYRKPEVAIIATGDELVQPGETPRPDQIIASNGLALAAMVEAEGSNARVLPIARDTKEALAQVFDLVDGADLIITIGGASVGDHDLVGQVAATKGLDQSFYKVAMRPGKPLMAGRMGTAAMIGLPGNPVSSLVCGQVFVLPMLRAFQGLPKMPAPCRQVPLNQRLEPNGPREHYMRARVDTDGAVVADRQDSSLLSVLADANALLVRAPHDPAKPTGALVDIIDL